MMKRWYMRVVRGEKFCEARQLLNARAHRITRLLNPVTVCLLRILIIFCLDSSLNHELKLGLHSLNPQDLPT